MRISDWSSDVCSSDLGGAVEPHDQKEFGYAEIRARGHSKLLRDIEDRVNDEGHGLLDVWMSHGDRVVRLPDGFKCIAATPDLPFAGMADEARGYYGLQFHAEVTHTKQGARIRSEEHTSELKSLMRISYAVFCLKK